MEECPHCMTTVMPMINECCPNCKKALAVQERVVDPESTSSQPVVPDAENAERTRRSGMSENVSAAFMNGGKYVGFFVVWFFIRYGRELSARDGSGSVMTQLLLGSVVVFVIAFVYHLIRKKRS